MENWLTTVIILFIAAMGYTKGLGGLEKMESISMTAQLAIVVALMLGLAVFGVEFIRSGESLKFDYPEREWSTQLRILAGALLVVQGFETSRFLGEKYSPEVRVSTMRKAQIISGIQYVVSVILLMPVVQHLDLMHIELAEIIEVTGMAALVLPIMLIGAITLASRAFAIYYLLQTLLALNYCYQDCEAGARATWIRRLSFVLVAIVLTYVVLFAIPAE